MIYLCIYNKILREIIIQAFKIYNIDLTLEKTNINFALK